MKYAYPENGVVLDVVARNPYLLFAPPYASQFIEAPDEVHLGWTYSDGVFSPPVLQTPMFDRHVCAAKIDAAVAEIYSRFTRFQLEYTEREAQAQAYKDAGYTGEVPPRVAEFVTPAGMPAQAATDLILAQSANLRTAHGALSALRMRKYEVLRAATDAQAQAFAAEILAGVEAVGRAVQ